MVSILSDGRLSVGRGVPPTGMTEAEATVKARIEARSEARAHASLVRAGTEITKS
jgi:hypothetical protein